MTPIPPWMSQDDLRRWRTACTLTDLGRLMAAWLEGDLATTPTYSGLLPEKETAHLIPALAAACRAGYVTTNSQPGQPPQPGYDGRIWQQRAVVTGWISDDQLLARIRCKAAAAGILTVATRPGRRARGRIPVTLADDEMTAGLGWSPGHRRVISSNWGGTSAAARRHLRTAAMLTLVDPEWGRDDVLWPLLTQTTPAAQRAR
jgi:hypothetical protein